jgi:transposase
VKSDIEQEPQAFNFSQGFWDGPLLSHHIEQKYGVILGVRQCQRLFRQLGYALLRPRPKPAGAKPEVRDEFKKNRMRP